MRHSRGVVYQLYFSHVFVEFEGPLQQPGQVVPMFTWRVGSSGATYAKSCEEAVAAIERELLAIKSAIPDRPTLGPRYCKAHGGYGFTSDCVACSANETVGHPEYTPPAPERKP